MLDIILSIYIFGCFLAIACMIISHNTIGKTDEYYRIHTELLPFSVATIMSWFSVYVYFKQFYLVYKNKPKDSCKKG